MGYYSNKQKTKIQRRIDRKVTISLFNLPSVLNRYISFAQRLKHSNCEEDITNYVFNVLIFLIFHTD